MTRKMLLRELDTSEWAAWVALYELEAEERKREEARARAKRGRRR